MNMKFLDYTPFSYFQPYMEPKQLLAEAVEKKGLKPDAFYTLYHGEVKQLS